MDCWHQPIASGNAISTYPLWGIPYIDGRRNQYGCTYVAGAVALLLDVAAHQLYQNDTLAVYQALTVELFPDNLQPVEQGFGGKHDEGLQELKDRKDSFTAYEVSHIHLGSVAGPHYGEWCRAKCRCRSRIPVPLAAS